MSGELDGRFKDLPEVIAQGTTQYSEGDAAEEYIAGLAVNIQSKPADGLAFRIMLAGTRATGTNGALTIKFYLNSTAVLSLAADSNASGDWICKATIIFVNPKVQKCCGSMHLTSADSTHDYAGATADCSAGATLRASMTLASGDDACTCEMWTVERWKVSLS
jgi:hypothetical protein